MPSYPLHTLKQLIFYASYLVFPFILLLIHLYYRFPKRTGRTIVVGLCVLTVVFIYARFIEPKMLVVKKETVYFPPAAEKIPSIKIAIFADVHRGIFTNTVSLDRVVEQVNQEHPDLVLIPGDFLYELDEKEFEKTFAPLKSLASPTYAVTGNHDVGFPGIDYGKQLDQTLTNVGIKVIDNKTETLTVQGQKVSIVGLSDLWQGQANYDVLNPVTEKDLVIVLTHNPDTAFDITMPQKADLLVAGHTHGGQIRLPILYRYVIPTKYNFDKGLHFANNMNVFVTPGIGMVGLPFRFLMPPQINMVTLNFDEQKQNNAVLVPKQIK